jgi:hypothetical protein
MQRTLTVIAVQRTPTVIAVLDTAIFLPTYRVTTNKDTFCAKKRPLQKQRPLLSLQQSIVLQVFRKKNPNFIARQ